MISVIIPVLNEERVLPGALRRVFSQAGEAQVIVADGGSSDRTLELVSAEPGIKLVHAPIGRARQMNAGAAEAGGDWLLFLHADTLLPEDALLSIARLPAEVEAGGFTHQFSGKARGLRVVSWLHNFRCRRTKVFYGDQALFVRRRLFVELGGFPDVPILEDVMFGERLRQVTRPTMLGSCVVTDSRKFEQHGIWTSLLRVLLILASYELRLPIPARKFFANVR